MKATGIIRKVDELGRIVVPKELRKALNIKERDALEIYTEEDKIILKKYVAGNTCDITGEIIDNPIELDLGNKKIVLSEVGLTSLINKLEEKIK